MDLNYRVGSKVFQDKFQAADHAYRTNQQIQFNLFESVFDEIDWSREPAHSWDQLLDLRAKQIADKNRPIILHFSGGTDSYTIYKVFERNRIPLSALVLNYRGDLSEPMYVKVHKFLQQGIYDPHCRIIYHNYLESDTFADLYTSQDWCWTAKERHQFGIYSGTGNGDQRMSLQLGQEAISVVGTDKPRLRFHSRGVDSYQDDTPWLRHMKSQNLDSFFISPELPELHVKQSWMLKKYLQHNFLRAKHYKDFSLVNNHHNPVEFDWYEYSLGCGRYGDLANSNQQHILNRTTRLYVPPNGKLEDAVYTGRSWKDFERLRGSKTLTNYIGGLMSAAADGAGKYLGITYNNLLYTKSFYSKFYQMPW